MTELVAEIVYFNFGEKILIVLLKDICLCAGINEDTLLFLWLLLEKMWVTIFFNLYFIMMHLDFPPKTFAWLI